LVVLFRMRRYVQHEPFNIYCFEAKTWEHPVHNHTYHEIIFILKGKGIHTINGNQFAYKQGDVFLLGPEDYHSFEIASRTHYCYIRFMESFMAASIIDKNKKWNQILKLLLHSRFQSRGSIIQNESDKQRLRKLLSVLIEEYNNRFDSNFEMMRDNLMRTIMLILTRNANRQLLPQIKSNIAPVENIVAYVRQNIYNPQRLKIDHLSDKFNYAPNYLSIYFKKHTGEALKQYIVKCKIKLIEIRLLYSQASLAEIADEFSFTDESHLCKQFKKYTGLAPGAYREKSKTKI
jgi:AraC family transcriptional regulator, L-rhamnose operon regulatory protein RhaS